MKVRYERVPKDRPILRPQQQHHSPGYLSRLAESLLRVQPQPIGLLKDYTVIWGYARVPASRLKPEITHLMAAIRVRGDQGAERRKARRHLPVSWR